MTLQQNRANKNDTLYVVSPFFNPRNFESRKRLHRQFEQYMEQCGVVLITVEVAFKTRDFVVTDSCNPHHVQLSSPYEMWHKERAINIGIHHLLKVYPDAKKVAWIDDDVRFSNPNWVEDTLLALDHYDVIQLFSHAQNLGPKHEPLAINGSVFYNFINKIFKDNNIGTFKPYISMGHPGLAWAATIAALDKLGGLIDFCIHGTGDSHMANGLMGDIRSYYQVRQPSKAMLKALDAWQAKADLHIKKNIGYIPGICYHYWHGKMAQRQYKERWDIICEHEFDPYEDIVTGANMLYQWAGNKPDMYHDFRDAMIGRNEDSVDL